MLRFEAPPGRRRPTRGKAWALTPHWSFIDQILISDAALPKAQWHTAKRIYERLKDEHGFAGGYTSVKRYVRDARPRVTAGLHPRSRGPVAEEQDYAKALCQIVRSLPEAKAIRVIHTLSGYPASVELKRLEELLARAPRKMSLAEKKVQQKQAAFDWMRKVLQGELSLGDLAKDVGDLPDLGKLRTALVEGRLSVRNKALAVLARKKGITIATVQSFLNLSKETVLKYRRCYDAGGVERLMAKRPSVKKSDSEDLKRTVVELVHKAPIGLRNQSNDLEDR